MTNNEELAGCLGKEGFKTYAAAIRVAKRPRIKNPYPIEVYRCSFCNEFHLCGGNRKKKRNGPRKKRTIR